MCCSHVHVCWMEEGGGGEQLTRISIDPGGGGGTPEIACTTSLSGEMVVFCLFDFYMLS